MMELQSMDSQQEAVHNVLNNNGKDHSQGVTSLPIMSTDYTTSDTMMAIFLRNTHSSIFLKITAGYWPDMEVKNAGMHKAWFITVRAIIMAFIGFNMFYLISSIVFFDLISITGFAANILGFGSVVPAQYLNQLRLQLPAHFQDATVLDESRKVAVYYGAVCTVALLLSLLFLGLGGGSFGVFIVIGSQFTILLYLTFNMLFLILDLKASSLLLDQLHILADNKMLDMHKFKMVRSDIHRRVEASRWASDIIVAPCVASALFIAVIVLVADVTQSVHKLLYLLGIICIMMKEIVFVMVAFRYVAKVNGKADELTVKMGKDMYCTDPEDVRQLLPDIQRVSIHASSLSEPITFPLLFKRVSWQNVMVSAAGFGVTILVSIVKTILKT